MKSFFTTIQGSILLGSLIVSISILMSSGVIKLKGVSVGNTPISQTTQLPTQPTQQGSNPNQKVSVDLGHLPIKGEKGAKVAIVEFGDFRCPFCDKFFKETEPQIIKDYINTGKAKFTFRHFAILGPASEVAANGAECANEQGKFWEFHDYLYQNQPDESDTSLYTTDKLTGVAQSLGLNIDQFKSCLDSKKYDKNVKDDTAAAQKAGATGTPTININGIQIVGAQPYSAFKTVIDQQLSQ